MALGLPYPQPTMRSAASRSHINANLDVGTISGAALLRNLDEEAANADGSGQSRMVAQHGAQHVRALGKTGAILHKGRGITPAPFSKASVADAHGQKPTATC